METYKKAIVLAMLFLCLNISAHAQKTTLNVNNVTVKQAMEALHTATGYTFVFSSNDVDTGKKVSVKADNADINNVIRQILKGQDNVKYKIEGKEIIITKQNGSRTSGGGRKCGKHTHKKHQRHRNR